MSLIEPEINPPSFHFLETLTAAWEHPEDIPGAIHLPCVRNCVALCPDSRGRLKVRRQRPIFAIHYSNSLSRKAIAVKRHSMTSWLQINLAFRALAKMTILS